MSENGVLLTHLPALYRSERNPDLHAFLSVLEAVLFEDTPDKTLDDLYEDLRNKNEKNKPPPGIEAWITRIPELFSPERTREDFLPWLAEWVALSHTEQLPNERLRSLLADIVPLYAKRGTRLYLARLLDYFIQDGLEVLIDDQRQPGCQLGYSTLGTESRLEAENPYWFGLKLRYQKPLSKHRRGSLEQTVRAVTDLAKPAHTVYDIVWEEG